MGEKLRSQILQNEQATRLAHANSFAVSFRVLSALIVCFRRRRCPKCQMNSLDFLAALTIEEQERAHLHHTRLLVQCVSRRRRRQRRWRRQRRRRQTTLKPFQLANFCCRPIVACCCAYKAGQTTKRGS
jgi:hypothetical protein